MELSAVEMVSVQNNIFDFVHLAVAPSAFFKKDEILYSFTKSEKEKMHNTYWIGDFINVHHPIICNMWEDIVGYHCFFTSLFISEQVFQ